MTAKKKAIIAVVVGAVLGVMVAVLSYNHAMEMVELGRMDKTGDEVLFESAMMVGVFMLYSFGYAFGWRRSKGFLAKAVKVSADITFFALLIHIITGKGFGKGLFLAMFVLCFAVSVVWLPGVIWGIQALINENRATT